MVVKKFLLAVASLAVVASPLAASAQSYGHANGSGRDGGGNGRGSQERGFDQRGDQGGYGREDSQRGRGDYRRESYGDGGGAVLAGIAGLFLGAALTSSQSYGYSHSYGYSQPYDDAPAQYQRCGWQNQAYDDGYGNVEYRQVQVCR
jgi:hypothetical protein